MRPLPRLLRYAPKAREGTLKLHFYLESSTVRNNQPEVVIVGNGLKLHRRPASRRASRRHNLAQFGGTAKMAYLCVSERGGAQVLPLFAFLGQTILYERKNYLI